VAPFINNQFPYIPSITDFAIPNDEGDNAPIQLTTGFRLHSFYQPNYKTSLLQPEQEVFDVGNELHADQKADITNSPFLVTAPSNSVNNNENALIGASVAAWSGQLLNIDTSYNRTCFGQDPTQHPNAKDSNGDEAVELSRKFCGDIIYSWKDTTPIPPSVRDNALFQNTSREYTLKNVNEGTHLGFFAVADPASFIQARSAKQFFEGINDDSRVEHCVLTYKDIIRYVSCRSDKPCNLTADYLQCDTDVNKRRGGVLKLNDRLYGVYTTPDDRGSHLPWLTDYTSLDDLQCTDYNATSYWRIATSAEHPADGIIPVAITDTDNLSKLCSCWYSAFPFTADLFCKGAAANCEDLAREDKRKAAFWDNFICS
jgi:hypothetical protein